jgi:uncharacterized membrane protein
MRRAERQVVIEAAPHACFDAALDLESVPDWQRGVRSAEVLSRDGDGRGQLVAFELDARGGAVHYTVEYRYDPPSLVSWRYVDGDVRGVEGELVLEDRGDGTTLATYALRRGPAAYLAGAAAGVISEDAMQGAVEDLKRRVEGAS